MNFNTIYTNGCSHTAGHRLGDLEIINSYVKKYNLIPWENERDINFPKRLKKHFNCELIDESQCGAGSPRVVRQTFEYISNNNLSQIKNTLFVLLFNIPFHRLEYYCKKINDYLIVNVQYNDDETFRYVNVAEKYSKTDRKYDSKFFEEEIVEDVKLWLTKYHDPMVYMKKITNEIQGLFSFFDLHNVNYFYGFDGGFHGPRYINKKRILNIDSCQTIYEYCDKHQLTLHHELEDNSNDFHPGYFGHLKFSEELIKFLNNES